MKASDFPEGVDEMDVWMFVTAWLDANIRDTTPAGLASTGFICWAFVAAAMEHPEWAQGWLTKLEELRNGDGGPPPVREILRALPISLADGSGSD